MAISTNLTSVSAGNMSGPTEPTTSAPAGLTLVHVTGTPAHANASASTPSRASREILDAARRRREVRHVDDGIVHMLDGGLCSGATCTRG